MWGTYLVHWPEITSKVRQVNVGFDNVGESHAGAFENSFKILLDQLSEHST